jgi:hypothetical protein
MEVKEDPDSQAHPHSISKHKVKKDPGLPVEEALFL